MASKPNTLDIQVKPDNDLTRAEYAEIIALTTQAFRRDYTPYMEMFHDSTHLLARYQGRLVTYMALITRWLQVGLGLLLRAAYIEGMATDLEYRNRGFASQVMRRAIQEARDFDIAALSTGSQPFYERLGWRIWQGRLYARRGKELIPMPGERGCVMVYSLPKTPPLDITAPLSVEWREIEPW